ncbi:MAG: DUF1996 domain-containing protein [Gammaproteobacteria bacterium]|nr:DUF1996 domain-containing protein [Gammaproteobacteria bacterium]
MNNWLKLMFVSIVFLLVACSGSDDSDDSDDSGNNEVLAPEIVSYTASSTTITAGESVTLSWTLSGGLPTLATINPGDLNVLSQSTVITSPAETTTYTLFVSNDTGNDSAEVTVTVNPVTGTNVEILSRPAEVTIESGARFTFAHSSATEFECSLDQAAYASCESPFFIRDLEVGVHNFIVRVAGDSSSEATYSWDIRSVFTSALAEDFVTFTDFTPGNDPDGGSFRVKCEVSHFNYDDALVSPGQPNAAHLHMYLGNTSTDNSTTIDSLASSGTGTCEGSFLNRSGYWMPAMLYPTDNAEAPFGLVMPFQGDEAPNVYYKSAVDDTMTIQRMPSGLRMISGSASANPANPQDVGIVRWRCESWTITSSDDFVPHVPRCLVGDWVRAMVFFPPCWDGENLSAANHKDHMAFPTWTAELGLHCPASHPVALPQVQFEVVYEVTTENSFPHGDSRMWRLASDSYEVTDSSPGGYSFHADWMLSWHPEIIDAWTEHCVRQGRHCSAGQLGNGWQLAPRQATDPDIPEVIMPSMGGMHKH